MKAYILLLLRRRPNDPGSRTHEEKEQGERSRRPRIVRNAHRQNPLIYHTRIKLQLQRKSNIGIILIIITLVKLNRTSELINTITT